MNAQSGGKKGIPIPDGWDGPFYPPDPPEFPKVAARKNRKRWCKGIPGREHDWIWMDFWEARGNLHTPQQREEYNRRIKRLLNAKIQVCRKCGKHGKFN